MNPIIQDILNDKYVTHAPIKSYEHFGTVLRFTDSLRTKYIAIHEHIGFQKSGLQYYIGTSSNHVSITKEEFNLVKQYVDLHTVGE